MSQIDDLLEERELMLQDIRQLTENAELMQRDIDEFIKERARMMRELNMLTAQQSITPTGSYEEYEEVELDEDEDEAIELSERDLIHAAAYIPSPRDAAIFSDRNGAEAMTADEFDAKYGLKEYDDTYDLLLEMNKIHDDNDYLRIEDVLLILK